MMRMASEAGRISGNGISRKGVPERMHRRPAPAPASGNKDTNIGEIGNHRGRNFRFAACPGSPKTGIEVFRRC